MDATVTPLLSVRDLSVAFRHGPHETLAVDRVSFDLAKGETLALVGESGSGKSVAMLAVMGLLPWTAKVTADRMQFAGRELLGLGKSERRRIIGKDIAMIFQEPMSSLNPCFKVGYQLTEALKTHLDLDKAGR